MDLLASGRDADIFVLDAARVLRRYRDGRPADAEAEVIRAVHAAGFPAPEVFDVDGPAIVMERLTGPTLGQAMLAGQVAVDHGAQVLADLHARLHDVPWPGGEPLLHLDLHPLNVIWAPRGAVVVDWTNARPGPADLDVAMTMLILAQTAVAPPPADVLGDLAGGDAGLLTAFLMDYLQNLGACVPASYTAQLEHATTLRRQNRTLSPHELAALDEAFDLARSAQRGTSASRTGEPSGRSA
jgi:aminoglycoside phosphotransferase (APT) family kinase protein